MNINHIIILARRHLGGDMESSARLCLSDAIRSYESGDMFQAKNRALKSLEYSVGLFSPIYKRASDHP